jgi:hypothetical protein
VHKEKNIKSHLAPEHHKLLSLKLKAAWGETDYLKAHKELQKVHDWLAMINIAAAQKEKRKNKVLFESVVTLQSFLLSCFTFFTASAPM